MNYLKKIGFGLLYTVIPILVSTLIVTLLHYFGIISKGFLSIMEILIPSLSLFVGGFQIGRRSKQKGWLEGIKEGLIVVVLMIIFSFLAFQNGFEIKNIIYYIILITSSTLGSMIGINFKKKGDSK